MSNIFENRVSATLTPAQITAVKTAIGTIATNMPFLMGLTVEERANLPKIAESNKVFVQDALSLMKNNNNIMPAYIDAGEVDRDYNLYNQLDEIASLLNQLTEKVNDTQMRAGHEAYVTTLSFYRMAEAAANAGVPGADAIYDQLKARFAAQGGAAPAPEPVAPQ